MLRCILLFALISISSLISAQSYNWGIKGGLTLGKQRGAYSPSVLFKFHGDLFLESYSEEDRTNLGVQLGYHPRGSAIRSWGFSNGTSGTIVSFTNNFLYNNAVLAPYAKQKFKLNDKFKGYYSLGFRLEYTFGSNLPSGNDFNNNVIYYYYPIKENIRKWNYGPMLAAGIQLQYSELVDGFIEFNFSPDLSSQYYQLPLQNVRSFDPYTGVVQNISLPEQSNKNLSFEITFGFRFLRKIEYID